MGRWTTDELIAMVLEFVEADQRLDVLTRQLRDANDRADVLYVQWVQNPDDEELLQRRRENATYCLQLANEHSNAQRRQRAARRKLEEVSPLT